MRSTGNRHVTLNGYCESASLWATKSKSCIRLGGRRGPWNWLANKSSALCDTNKPLMTSEQCFSRLLNGSGSTDPSDAAARHERAPARLQSSLKGRAFVLLSSTAFDNDRCDNNDDDERLERKEIKVDLPIFGYMFYHRISCSVTRGPTSKGINRPLGCCGHHFLSVSLRPNRRRAAGDECS